MSGNVQCLIVELVDVISNGLGLNKTTLSAIVVGIALFIGFILTFKGKKCFKYTLTIIACLSGILAPFFVTGLHHWLSNYLSIYLRHAFHARFHAMNIL